MRASELKTALCEIQDIFAASGSASVANAVGEFATFIDQQGDRDLDEVVAEIAEKLDPVARKQLVIARHVKRLKQSNLVEAAFQEALAVIRADKALDAADVLKIAKDFGVIRIGGKTRAAVIESIDKHFYWLVINRDADAMAQRATPW
jgi:glycosyltransferase A (GT-A) superfamily protein (DUF2064 family)